MAFPLFRRTFLCCSLGQTVIGEIDIERRPFPFHGLTGSPIFERERFNEGAVYSPLLNLSAAERKMISLQRAQRPGEIYIPVESGWALS